MAETDPFKTSAGGWDDFDCTWTEVRFGFNPSYSDEDGNLILTMLVDWATDDPDIGDAGVLMDQVVTIGKGWEAEDDGARVVRGDGRSKGYNNQTYLGMILDRCMELNEKQMRARHDATQLTPMDAGFWEGMRTHMEQCEVKSFDGSTRSKLMPTALYGWEEGENGKPGPEPVKKTVAKKRGPGRPKKEAVAEMQVPAGKLEGVEPEMLAAIIKMAETADSDEDFIDRCYAEVEGLDSNPAAMSLVDDVEAHDSVWMIHGKTG